MSCHGQQYTCSNCGSGALKQRPGVHYTSPVYVVVSLLFLGIEKKSIRAAVLKKPVRAHSVPNHSFHTQNNYFLRGDQEIAWGKRTQSSQSIWLTFPWSLDIRFCLSGLSLKTEDSQTICPLKNAPLVSHCFFFTKAVVIFIAIFLFN